MVLPVTLLSGFLGAGKTTLLQHILKNKKNLRCAVIVNDMAELNIDANLISESNLVQQNEQFVQLENGCICCTLRADLLQSLSDIADKQKVDYIVIESTGISEPMQVAETFVLALEESNMLTDENLPSLKGKAFLDTCVTVIDAVNFFNYFTNSQTLGNTYKDVAKEDDRNISTLMVDQIEFADVIMINKTDLVEANQLQKIRNVIKSLNAKAKIYDTNYSQIDLSAILNTKLFDMDKAITHAGWLKSLQEEMIPETEEYGVDSFVYRRRKPFHPQRLLDFIKSSFVVIEPNIEHPKSYYQNSKHYNKSVFSHILRSKGSIWINSYNKDKINGDWGQAGTTLTISPRKFWFCEMDQEFWPETIIEDIKADFVDGIGDRKQEIVFIGFDAIKNRKIIEDKLDQCLCTEKELKQNLDDPFSIWYFEEDLSEFLQEDSCYSVDQINEKSSIIYCKDPKNITSDVQKLIDKNKSSLIVPSFISTDKCLDKLVSFGDSVALNFFFEEQEYGTDINKLTEQFLKEIEVDIKETVQTYEDEGLKEISATLLSCLPILQDTAKKMLKSYDRKIATYGDNNEKDPFLFLLYIEVNMLGACIKLHSDTNGARAVVSLANGGTVVTDSQHVNWDKWIASNGMLPEESMNWNNKEQLQNTRSWNNSLCNPQYQLQVGTGDMLMMKGSMVTDRPCIHRAPYTAGDLDESKRILVKLDYLPKSKIQVITDLLNGDTGSFMDTEDDLSQMDEEEDFDF